MGGCKYHWYLADLNTYMGGYCNIYNQDVDFAELGYSTLIITF